MTSPLNTVVVVVGGGVGGAGVDGVVVDAAGAEDPPPPHEIMSVAASNATMLRIRTFNSISLTGECRGRYFASKRTFSAPDGMAKF